MKSRGPFTIREATNLLRLKLVIATNLMPTEVAVIRDTAYVGYLVPTDLRYVIARYDVCRRIREMARRARKEVGLQ